jgi:hypothetical protein
MRAVSPDENIVNQQLDADGMVETLVAALGSGGDQIEWQDFARIDFALAFEALGAVIRNDLALAESGATTEIGNLPFELLALQRSEENVATELLATLIGKGGALAEWASSAAANLTADTTSPIEFLAAARADPGVVAEAMAAAVIRSAIENESQAAQQANAGIAGDFVLGVLGGRGSLFESLVSARADPSALGEWLAAAFVHALIPDEFVLARRADGSSPTEALAGVRAAGGIPSESSVYARIDFGALAEWTTGAHADVGALLIEALSGALIDALVADESTARSSLDANSPLELLSLVNVLIADALLLLESGGSGGVYVLPRGTTTRFIANVGSFMGRRH